MTCLEPEAYSEHCQTSMMERFCRNSYLAHFSGLASKFFHKKLLYICLKKPALKKLLIFSQKKLF